MRIIGIDLGTTNSLVTCWQDGEIKFIPNIFGDILTPSIIGLDDNGDILIGKTAKERLISHPHLTVGSFKSFIGTNKKLSLGDKEFSPEELSSFVLKKLKIDAEKYLGEIVTEAIVSVPAYFNDNQRSATKIAAHLARLRLINEPSAAALTARYTNMDKDCSYLVVDFGGGTMDLSIVDCFDSVIEIVAIAGDNHLGGNDFDLAIVDFFCAQNQIDFNLLTSSEQSILFSQAEQCKKLLTKNQIATMAIEYKNKVLTLSLTKELLTQILMPLLQRIDP